jgi:hypothetical protein
MKYFVITTALLKMQKFVFVLHLGSINGDTIFQLQMKSPWFCRVHNPEHLAISYFATVMDRYIRLVTSILPMLRFNTRSSSLGVKMDGIQTWFSMKIPSNVKVGFGMHSNVRKSEMSVA